MECGDVVLSCPKAKSRSRIGVAHVPFHDQREHKLSLTFRQLGHSPNLSWVRRAGHRAIKGPSDLRVVMEQVPFPVR